MWESLWTLLDNVEVWDDVADCGRVWKNVGECRTIGNMTMWESVGQCGKMWDYVGECGRIIMRNLILYRQHTVGVLCELVHGQYTVVW